MNLKIFIKKFINLLQRDGKKIKGFKIFITVLQALIKNYKKNPSFIMQRSLFNSTPVCEIRRIKKGSQFQYVPKLTMLSRRQSLAMRWLVRTIQKTNKNIVISLASELFDSSLKKGKTFEKKIDLLKKINNIKLNLCVFNNC